MEPTDDPARWAAICSLEDPTRRRLYDHVASRARPVSRDEAAHALAIDRSLAAYHLDKLTEHGLLTASFARPAGRGGPGAGRPAKRYELSNVELSASLPYRDYHLAAELLVRAAEGDPTGTVRAALATTAATYGRELLESSTATDLSGVLKEHGYGPWDDQGTLRLRNCPFHRLAHRHTELICGMNLAILSALAQSTPDHLQAVLDPGPDRCCVVFRRESAASRDD